MKEAWYQLRQATVHYIRANRISNMTFDSFAKMAKDAHRAIFNYAKQAEALFGPTICTYNLHTLVCRGYKQELARGPMSRETEFWLERKIQDLKQRIKYRAKSKAEVVLVNDLQDTLALERMRYNGPQRILRTASELLEGEKSSGYQNVQLRGRPLSISKTNSLKLQHTLATFWEDYYRDDASGWGGDDLQVADVLYFSRCTIKRDGREFALHSEADKRTCGTLSYYVLVTYEYQGSVEQYVAKIKMFLEATPISRNRLKTLQLAITDLFLANASIDGKQTLHRLLMVPNLQQPNYSDYPVKVMDIRETLIACVSPTEAKGHFIVDDPDEEL